MNKLSNMHRRTHYRQRGNSVVALPLIILMGMTLILFGAKVNSAISTKASLERLSYALTSIIASSHLGTNPSLKKGDPVITQKVADALLVIATRQLAVRERDNQRQVGIQVGQLQQTKASVKAKATVFQSGVPCSPRQDIGDLKHLSPLGRTQGLNRGQRADLFQVSVCITGVSSLSGAGVFASLEDFSANYYQSDSILIGREFTGVGP